MTNLPDRLALHVERYHRPNFFSSTSELTQDAFLCWLIAWADARFADVSPALHSAGRQLLALLLRKGGASLPEGPVDLRIERQFKRIDILVVVNAELGLIIEDKTYTGVHNPLKRYRETVLEALPKLGAVCGVIVTRSEEPTGHSENRDFGIVGREDLLGVLAKAGDTSDEAMDDSIFRDFYLNLKALNAQYHMYRTRPVVEWMEHGGRDHAWRGLRSALLAELGGKPAAKLSDRCPKGPPKWLRTDSGGIVDVRASAQALK